MAIINDASHVLDEPSLIGGNTVSSVGILLSLTVEGNEVQNSSLRDRRGSENYQSVTDTIQSAHPVRAAILFSDTSLVLEEAQA